MIIYDSFLDANVGISSEHLNKKGSVLNLVGLPPSPAEQKRVDKSLKPCTVPSHKQLRR